ncbi:uncharacterized protein plekhg6 isoform X2 [Cyclopterus lumpus]|uniref:uncharacterized protein plekhg6 isoform X2 n=1 Tax=Cyclopterus lumpus TaxID=8103 RepID=UPI0014871E8A|nr:uncharacterized protein plekhg6 isoform X2 [Cyclopterus lumpus]
MDPTKPSLSSKAQHVAGGGNVSLMGEPSAPQRDSVDGERQKDTDSDVDGTTAAAEINHHHKGSADKHKFNTFGYQKRTKQKIVTYLATVNKGPSAVAKPRAALRQVLFSQGGSEKNPASEERCQLGMLKQDLETFAVPLNLKWRWKEESQGTTLEKNWTDIVDSHSLVIAALVNLHQHGFLLEVTPELLFFDLPSILTAHQLFWQEVIYPMLEEVRRTGQPFDPMALEAGCLQFHERFSSYQHYCWEEENNLEFTRRQMEGNPHFLTYVQWVETHPQCERMRLGDMQAKPHQRITKYPLLLMAVLKTTQDPNVQHTLRGMLSSVNSFLESINDHLKLQDEQLALNISAQRVEGYEVECINEDIDTHVREICQFDLTCPIRGVGPEVVRKLLLEENLKIRERKDSKLEVVALLFSDVLLMTKVQKKGERLKVVRPPLALDRTYCIALKDGCSFVLVEVGELRSAINVYIFAASTSGSCSKWVSTIHQAKETLWTQRQTESNRQLENWKIRQLDAKPLTEAKMDDMETEEQPLTQSRQETFVDEHIIPQSINGMLASKEAEEQHQPPDAETTTNPALTCWHSQPNVNNRTLVHEAGWQKAVNGYEWIEMEARGDNIRVHREEEEKRGQRVWNHRAQSAPNLDTFRHGIAAEPLQYNTAGPQAVLYPDIDYPTEEESTIHLPDQPDMFREESELLGQAQEEEISTNRDSDSQSVNQDSRRNSDSSQSGDMQTSPESWGCSKNLKSPGLRRRRPNNTQQSPSSQISHQFFQDSGQTNSLSFSNPNSPVKRNSLPSGSESHRVLKLGSLKHNQGMFLNMHDRLSPDPQTLSESELPDPNVNNRVKPRRRASIPNIINEGGHGLGLHTSSLYTFPQAEDAPFPKSNRDHSALESLLERAKERDVLKRDRKVKMANLSSRNPPSPSFSTTPSPSPMDGDRETGWEEEVELIRHRALTVSKGWKEQLVDGDDDDKSNSVFFTDGVNVDWTGWCLDDEVLDVLQPGDEGFLEDIPGSLASWDIPGLSEQDDREYSQV